MEEIYTSLSQSGRNLDEAASGGETFCGAKRNQQPTSELGSSEYIERLKRTRQVVAKTSFRQPKSAGDSAMERGGSGMGAKFEHLGKTSYTLRHSSKNNIRQKTSASSLETGVSERSIHKAKDSAQILKPSSRGKEDRKKEAGNRRSKTSTRPSRTRSEALSIDADDDSSDELLLTSSSQPVETPPKKRSIPISDAATGPPESDSDDADWRRRSISSETTSGRVSSSSSKKPQPHSHKPRIRSDENSFSDETPDKKKRRLKPRAAYGKQRNTSDTFVEPLKGKHESGWHASSALNDRPMNLTEHADEKSSKASSLCDPIKLLLEEKGKEDKTPRASKIAEGINVQVVAPFPMARERLADRSLTSAGDTRKSRPAPFPLSKDTGVSKVTTQKNRHAIESPSEDLDSESSEDSDDPLLINSNDIILRGGLAPFPMSLRDRPDKSPKRSGSQRGSSSRIHGPRVGIHRDPDETKQDPDVFLDVPEIVDFSFTQPADPKTLCPYCDMPFPPDPSPLLLDMLERIPKYPDARPTNPLGLKAPLLSYVSMCQRHQFEIQLLPTAQAAGWPTCIDFAVLPDRIRVQRQRLERMLYEKEKSVFWRELKQDINKQGVKKTMGIANQFDSFEKCQPGYYGEQGAVIIFQTLSHLFPPDTTDANYVAPLTLTEFLRYVLVPECAVALIQEDLGRGTTIEYAMRTLRESSKYGTAMFPDLDNRDAMSLAEGDHDAQRVGDALIQERVRTRRLEIDEEERSEGASQEMGGRDTKPSGRPKSREVTKENDNGVEGTRERARTSRKKARTKASMRGKKGRGDVIELSDSCSERTDTSASDRPRRARNGETSTLSDQPAKSRRSVNPSKQSQSRAGAMTSNTRPKPAVRPRPTSRAIVSEDEFLRNDMDEATPRPAVRIYRSPYESDSGIVLPEEDNLYEKVARSKTASSGSGAKLKLKGSSQPLKAAKERKSRKEVVFRKTMWENDDADESDNTSSQPDTDADAGAKRTKPLIKTNSHSWLWSDSSTPSASPSS